MSLATYKDLCIDASDAPAVAAFWAPLLGWEAHVHEDGDASLRRGDGVGEQDAQPPLGGGAEGDTPVLERAPGADGLVALVGAGDAGPGAVAQGGDQLPPTEADPEHDVVDLLRADRPDLPEPLELIYQRAVSYSPGSRFESALAMQQALELVMRSQSGYATSADVAAWVARLSGAVELV